MPPQALLSRIIYSGHLHAFDTLMRVVNLLAGRCNISLFQIYLTTGSFSQGIEGQHWKNPSPGTCRRFLRPQRPSGGRVPGSALGMRMLWSVAPRLWVKSINCTTWSQLIGPGINSLAKVCPIRSLKDKGSTNDPAIQRGHLDVRCKESADSLVQDTRSESLCCC